ncbi:hypothetical protein SteCoe_17015 [Stentor coeruleus]|uniref:Uncharacterized protein n=1 Tax=Stentor coeruleus TaxID=5963 RepID=A0A1R2BZY0_9CILI|nr:hypothetical protein SteCoe_17015 [Stentor coeruleus]
MQRPLKTDLRDLCISGTSTPIKFKEGRTFSADLHKTRIQTSTPDTKFSLCSKWYIRGHKFATIHKNNLKPKPCPILCISGTTHRRISTPNTKASLQVTQDFKVREKITKIVEKKNRTIFIPSLLIGEIRKCSSKSLQVDLEELSSWVKK